MLHVGRVNRAIGHDREIQQERAVATNRVVIRIQQFGDGFHFVIFARMVEPLRPDRSIHLGGNPRVSAF